MRGFERFLEVFRGFERFSEVFRGFQRCFRGFQRLFRGFQRSSQRPSQRQISSQRLSVLLPLIMLPLELSAKKEFAQIVRANCFYLGGWFSREGANREKLTVKKLIDNEMFFFSPFMSLTNREKSA